MFYDLTGHGLKTLLDAMVSGYGMISEADTSFQWSDFPDSVW